MAAAKKVMDAGELYMDDRQLRIDLTEKKKPKRDSFGGGKTWEQKESEPSSTLFIGNLSFNVDEDTMYQHFEGAVGVRLITDRETGNPKG